MLDVGLDDPVRTRRAPLLAVLVIGALVVVVLPRSSRELGATTSYVPAVLALVAAADLFSCYLLVREFLGSGDRRLLGMARAYAWSLVAMAGYAGAFPGVVAVVPPFATAPSVAPWLYVLWHVGFPVALALAWSPLPRSLSRPCPAEQRTSAVAASLVGSVVAAAAVVTVLVRLGPSLPVLIVGIDTSRMTRLTAPVALPLVAAACVLTFFGSRHRTGPERWSVVAVWSCLADLALTYGSHYRYSLGWYCGRTLTVVAAAVVLLAMLHDVGRLQTRLRRAVVETQELARLHRVVLDSLSEGVTLQDAHGILTANPAAVALLHLDDQKISQHAFEVVREDGTPFPRDERPTRVTQRTGVGSRDVLHGVVQPEGVLWLSVSTTPVLDDDGRPTRVVSSFTDVTEREERRRLLESSRDDALDAVAAKSAFLANVSHEIRTPLNGVLGLTELLLLSDLDDEQRRLARTAQGCGQALLALLNDVLDFSKVESGGLVLEQAPLDVRAVLDTAVGLVAATAATKRLALAVVVDDEVPAQVVGDALRLRQVLANLLSNAVKFTQTGGVEVRVGCGHDAGPGRVRLHVQVSDTGIGLPDGGAAHLFEPYQQADASTARSFGGTGLGLTIVRQMVALMQGEVGADPLPGGGSRFWFTVDVGAATSPAPAPRPAEVALGPLRGRVLVAEDNAVNAMVAQMLLAGWGLDVVCVADGQAAVDAVAAGGFDVVLMDAQMPVLDGVEATAAIRGRHGERSPQVLALSASARSEDRETFTAAGASGYLTKPIVPAEVHAAIAHVLRTRVTA
ncbi:MAG: rpfC 4 [Frankiales bacterium]|nr:rpfC 4 [Frankiales bacterium]